MEKKKIIIITIKRFLLHLANNFGCFFLSLGDFASPRSRPATIHVMTASRSVRELIFWHSVSQKGLDETRRTIDHTGHFHKLKNQKKPSPPRFVLSLEMYIYIYIYFRVRGKGGLGEEWRGFAASLLGREV